MAQRILMIVTSADHLPGGHETGVWLEEFAVPFLEFTQDGIDVTVASPQGGAVPIDPNSEDAEPGDAWAAARNALGSTRPLSEVRADPFHAVFFPGGHGPLMDLPDDEDVARLVLAFAENDKVIGAMCHGPAALLGVRFAGGRPFVEGRRLTSFTDAEEREMKLEDEVPFLLETALREQGAEFVAGDNWADHVERDGNLVTGQNPQSSRSAAREVIRAVQRIATRRPEARP